MNEQEQTVDINAALDADLNAVFDKMNTEEASPREDQQSTQEEEKTEEVSQSDQPEAEDTERAEETETPPAVSKPEAWSADQEKLWETLSPEAKQYVAQREREAQNRISELGQVAAEYDPIKQVIDEFPNTFAAHDLTPAEGIRNLLQVQELVSTNPVAGIQWIAEQFGVDLRLFSGLNDPNVQRLSHLERQLAAYETERRLQGQQSQAQEANQLVGAIDSWATDKEHFNDVLNEMAAIINATPDDGQSAQELLDEAYEKACWANPEVRKKLEAEKERTKTSAENRRLNSTQNFGNRAANSPSRRKFKSQDEEFDATYDEVVARLDAAQ